MSKKNVFNFVTYNCNLRTYADSYRYELMWSIVARTESTERHVFLDLYQRCYWYGQGHINKNNIVWFIEIFTTDINCLLKRQVNTRHLFEVNIKQWLHGKINVENIYYIHTQQRSIMIMIMIIWVFFRKLALDLFHQVAT